MATKSFGSNLAAAAAYCEKLGLGYDCVTQRSGRYVVKGNPAPRASRTKRKRRGKETKAEREARLADWRMLREDIRESKDRDQGARAERDEELGEIRTDCDTSRATTTRTCKTRRDDTRERARHVRDQEKEIRTEARDDYHERRGMTAKELAKSGLRYSKAESDSLTEQAIPDHLISIFRKVRHKIPYAMTPDYRADRFTEIYDEDRENFDAAELDELESRMSDESLARAHAEHEAESDLPF